MLILMYYKMQGQDPGKEYNTQYTSKDFLVLILGASMGNFLWMSLFIVSARMTIASHAEIFSGLCGSMLIVYRLIRKQPVS